MNKKLLKQIFLVFALMAGAIAITTLIPIASAAILGEQSRINELDLATGSETSLRALIVRMVNYFLTFLGLIAVIMVIYGGVTYVTSAGEEEKIGNAKKIIMYSLVGLIIVLLSYALVNTILGAGTGIE